MSRVKILLYGRLVDGIGAEVDLDAPGGSSIAELRTRLAAAYPSAAELLASKRVRACVGNVLVDDEHRPTPGEPVEFLPPVSGG